LAVQEAVLKAAQFVATPDADEHGKTDQFGEAMPPASVDVSNFVPRVRVAFPNVPERPTTLEPGPFGAEIKASLIWFPLADRLVLGWSTVLTMPDYAEQYHVIVDANNGEILYSHQTIKHVAAVGNVYRVDGSSARQMTSFPRPINDYGLPIPAD